MHFLGFCVSLALLLLASLLMLVAVVTKAWWITEDGEFMAGLWEQCHEGRQCETFEFGYSNSFKKLSGGTLTYGRGKAIEKELQNIDLYKWEIDYRDVCCISCSLILQLHARYSRDSNNSDIR